LGGQARVVVGHRHLDSPQAALLQSHQILQGHKAYKSVPTSASPAPRLYGSPTAQTIDDWARQMHRRINNPRV